MMSFLAFWRRKIDKIPKWLWLAIILTSFLLISGTFWKYHLFAYNALDLAIFNQVFWKTAHGELFGLTIHPHSYLGDHAGLIILALTPIYWLWQDPRTLLLLQSIALILPAAFIWQLVQARGKNLNVDRNWTGTAAVLLSAAWLASPAVHNAGFFEFHLLPFAVLPLLGAALAYERGDRGGFMAWSILALACREDVALLILMFSFLAWLEDRKIWWRLVPFFTGIIWFTAATILVRFINPSGGYKFMVYYEWLGHNPVVAATNVFIHPLRTLAHITTFANLEMAIALLMPLAFLPLLKPRRLLIAFLPLLQIILGAPGGGQNVTEMHYVALFLPALFLAATDGLLALPGLGWFDRLPLRREDSRTAIVILVAVCASYGFLALGPWPKVAASLFDGDAKNRAMAARDALLQIPKDAPVAASYALMPNISGRDSAYSLHYIFLGVTQFAQSSYPVPNDLEFLLVENDDLITYRAQFTGTAWAKPHYEGGRERLLAIADDGPWTNGRFTAYNRRRGLPRPWTTGRQEDEPRLIDSSVTELGGALTIETDWNQIMNAPDYQILVTVSDEDGGVIDEAIFPLLGLPPQTTESPAGIHNRLLLNQAGKRWPDEARITLTLVRQSSTMILDGWRSTVRLVENEESMLRVRLR